MIFSHFHFLRAYNTHYENTKQIEKERLCFNLLRKPSEMVGKPYT